MKYLALLLVALLLTLACGGAVPPPDAPGTFNAAGLKLIIGVERTRTLEVQASGDVVSSEAGQKIMSFVGSELRGPDGAATILTLDGNALRTPTKQLGTFDGDTLVIDDLRLWVKDDGVVMLTREGSDHKMRMHFDGSLAGHHRPALMLVAVVFSLFVAAHPGASIDRFVD
jgi:hypothetical protein